MILPSVSFIVPTLNSAATLRACLESIINQDYPAHCKEVIVADGGSTDATLRIIEELRDAFGESGLRVVAN